MATITELKNEIEKIKLSTSDKKKILDLLDIYYEKIIAEEADHIVLHLDATIKDNPENIELINRANLLKTQINKIKESEGHLATAIQDYLEK